MVQEDKPEETDRKRAAPEEHRGEDGSAHATHVHVPINSSECTACHVDSDAPSQYEINLLYQDQEQIVPLNQGFSEPAAYSTSNNNSASDQANEQEHLTTTGCLVSNQTKNPASIIKTTEIMRAENYESLVEVEAGEHHENKGGESLSSTLGRIEDMGEVSTNEHHISEMQISAEISVLHRPALLTTILSRHRTKGAETIVSTSRTSVMPGAVSVDGPNLRSLSQSYRDDLSSEVILDAETGQNSTSEYDTNNPTLVSAIVVTDEPSILLVEATPMEHVFEPCDVPIKRRWTPKQILCIVCVAIASIGLGVAISLAIRSPDLDEDKIVSEQFFQNIPAPTNCLPENGSSVCLDSTEAVLSAVDSGFHEIVLCPNTEIQLPYTLRLYSDFVAICCAGDSCILQASNMNNPLIEIKSQNVWLQRITFQRTIVYESRDMDRDQQENYIPGGGHVIVQGEGTHYIDSCIFEGGRATEEGGFQKYGGNLLIDGNMKGRAKISNSTFRLGQASRAGGGAFLEKLAYCEVEGCEFSYNTADFGGGLSVNDIQRVNITQNEFIGNSAYDKGSSIWIGSVKDVFLDRNTMQSNISMNSNQNCLGAFISDTSECIPLESA